MQLTDIKDRAADAVADTRERVREIATMRVETSVGRSALGTLVLVVGFAAAGVLWTWHVRRDEAARWRDRIAAASQHVRGAIAAGAADAAATDDAAINALGDLDARYQEAVAALKADRTSSRPSCAAVPAECWTTGSVRK